MKQRFLITVILTSICMCAQSQTDPALRESWTVFKMALENKKDVINDLMSAIMKEDSSTDLRLSEQIKDISDSLDLRLRQSNLDAKEIRTLLNLNKRLDERVSKVLEKKMKDGNLTKIEDFFHLQAELGAAMNRLYISTDRFNEIAEQLSRKDLFIDLHGENKQPPKVKF
jgi:polyhydroxyalkanoate synthesis regulator phasin